MTTGTHLANHMTNNITHNPYWAKSAGNLDIELYQQNSSEKPILIIGGVHGDEPEGVFLAQSCLKWLQKTHKENPGTILTPWLLIPCINPDGVKLDRRVNSNGVDLNRNFPSKNWSPHYQANRYFPGPFAGSEPEIKSLVQLINLTQPRLIIHCHSWIPMIVCTGAPGLPEARYLAKASGYPLEDHIGYPTPGSLSNFGWHDHQIPIICIEVPDRAMLGKVVTDGLWETFEPAFENIFYTKTKKQECSP